MESRLHASLVRIVLVSASLFITCTLVGQEMGIYEEQLAALVELPTSTSSEIDDSAVDLVEIRVNSHPNPFVEKVLFEFELQTAAMVNLQILNKEDEVIETIADFGLNQGGYKLQWDGSSTQGTEVPAGVYTYRFTVDEKEVRGQLTKE